MKHSGGVQYDKVLFLTLDLSVRVKSDMGNTGQKRGWLQFRLRALFILVTGACLFVWWDPWSWKPPGPIPIETVAAGEMNRVDLIEIIPPKPAGQIPPQVIFWSRYPDGELHVRESRQIGSSSVSDFQVDRSGRNWNCTWKEDGIERHVQAESFSEPNTPLSNPEGADRDSLAENLRVPLWSSATRPDQN